VLDGAAVFGDRDGELIAGLAAQTWVLNRRAVGVVVVAKVFAAERTGAAATSIGMEMAAEIADIFLRCGGFGLFDLFRDGHDGSPLPGVLCQNIQK